MNNIITRTEWFLFKWLRKRRLKNFTPTIISENCVAGIMLHDLGLKFNTPTINLGLWPTAYLKFLKNLKHYLSIPPEEVTGDDYPANKLLLDHRYPVGRIDDIQIHYGHYKSFDEAKAKWCERAQRVDYGNIFVTMIAKNGCTYEQMKEFDALPYQNKVLFTIKPYPEIKCAFHMPGFEDKPQVGIVTDFKPGFWRRRYLDAFDYVSFLNGEWNK